MKKAKRARDRRRSNLGRPKAAARDLVKVPFAMPPSVKERLRVAANEETARTLFGAIISSRELALRFIVDGLDRRDAREGKATELPLEPAAAVPAERLTPIP
jgi:hypothetical protein